MSNGKVMKILLTVALIKKKPLYKKWTISHNGIPIKTK